MRSSSSPPTTPARSAGPVTSPRARTASVVDQDVCRAELLLGGIEQHRGRPRIREISLHRRRPAARCPYLGHDRTGVTRTVIPVGPRGAGSGRILDPQERAQHRAATSGQGDRGRRPNAMIGTRHDRRMRSHYHRRLLRLNAESRPPGRAQRRA